MNYQNRVVAYIDILGFKSKLDSTINKDKNENPIETQKILEAYNAIISIWFSDDTFKNEHHIDGDTQINIFSDTIIISFLCQRESEIFHKFIQIKYMQMALIQLGIVCRGAITFGKLYHNDITIFGPALVEAYFKEKDIVITPRIIISADLVTLINKYKQSSDEMKLIDYTIEKDSDSFYYIDYFSKSITEFYEYLPNFCSYIEDLDKVILTGLSIAENTKDEKLKFKYEWMAEKFNKIIDQINEPNFIKHLQKKYNQEEIEDFSLLTKISLQQ